jgi:uncharacterized phage protein (TIGR02220 family)
MEEHNIIQIHQLREEETGRYGALNIKLLRAPQKELEFEEPLPAQQIVTGGVNSANGESRIGEITPPIEENLQPKEEDEFEEERILPLSESLKRSKSALQRAVEEVIAHLNLATGRSHDPQVSSTQQLRERLLKGAEIDECILLIDHRSALWFKDPKMTGYLRPATLFSHRHFDEYLQLALEWDLTGRPTLHPVRHHETASVAPTGERKEEWIEQWRQLSK